jgi:hypothetical protein
MSGSCSKLTRCRMHSRHRHIDEAAYEDFPAYDFAASHELHEKAEELICVQ